MNVPFALPAEPEPAGLRSLERAAATAVRRTTRLGYIALAIVIGIFLLWSLVAPLESAAIAPGQLRSEGGGRRVVQHLEGGIIRRLLVQEGSRVRAGQILAELDETASKATQAALEANYFTLLAQDARLTAERSGASRVTYPAELLQRRTEPVVAEILRASDQAFRAGGLATVNQVAILAQRAAQARADLGSAAPQLAALADQERSLSEEARNAEVLVGEKLERQSRLEQLRRQLSDVAAQRTRLTSGAAKTRDVIGESQAQIALVRSQRVTDASTQQRDVQASLAEAREKLRVSRDVDLRKLITAPVTGTVTNLRLVTIGGVLAAGQPLLDIVPSDTETVVIARLRANDIDVVHSGLAAEVRLTPYKTRSVPMLLGDVRKVSADATVDEKTGTVYYEVEIALRKADIARVPNIRLLSGMPSEVYIKLGSRTLMQYFLQPLVDSFRRAFRED